MKINIVLWNKKYWFGDTCVEWIISKVCFTTRSFIQGSFGSYLHKYGQYYLMNLLEWHWVLKGYEIKEHKRWFYLISNCDIYLHVLIILFYYMTTSQDSIIICNILIKINRSSMPHSTYKFWKLISEFFSEYVLVITNWRSTTHIVFLFSFPRRFMSCY